MVKETSGVITTMVVTIMVNTTVMVITIIIVTTMVPGSISPTTEIMVLVGADPPQVHGETEVTMIIPPPARAPTTTHAHIMITTVTIGRMKDHLLLWTKMGSK